MLKVKTVYDYRQELCAALRSGKWQMLKGALGSAPGNAHCARQKPDISRRYLHPLRCVGEARGESGMMDEKLLARVVAQIDGQNWTDQPLSQPELDLIALAVAATVGILRDDGRLQQPNSSAPPA